MVKRARKETLQETFCKAIQVEKDIFFLNENHDTLAEQASISCGKIKKFPKTTATNFDPFNVSDMKKLLQKMSNEMVDLKKNSNENKIIIGVLQGQLSRDLINLPNIQHL